MTDYIKYYSYLFYQAHAIDMYLYLCDLTECLVTEDFACTIRTWQHLARMSG
jgi:hypothetical protein